MPIAAANGSAAADAHASCWARETHGSWARISRPSTSLPYTTFTATPDERAVRTYREQHKAECEEGPGRRPGPRCFTSNQLYEWRPSGLQMRAPTAPAEFAATTCRVMHRLGFRRLVLMGDSIMRNQFSSMISLMGRRADSSFDYKSSGQKSFKCGGASDGGVAHEMAVELIALPEPSMLEFILAPWVAAGRPLPGSTQAARRGTMFELMLTIEGMTSEWLGWQEQHVSKLWTAFDDPKALYVFNMGAHYPRAFNTSGQAFRAFVRDALAIRQLIRLRAPGTHLVYRSTPAGHPECNTLTSPADEQTYARWASNLDTDRYDGWGWHLFAGFDLAAREIFAPLGAAAFLDVASPSAQRPDAHTAKRHGGGRLPPDCLHWSLPGVPDVWNYMLLGALMHCRV